MFGTRPSRAFTASRRSLARPVADSGAMARKRDTVTLSRSRCSRRPAAAAHRSNIPVRLAEVHSLVPSRTPEEGQQVSVDLILMRGCEAVGRARIVNLLRTFDEPRRFLRRVLDGNDLVVLAVQDQGG